MTGRIYAAGKNYNNMPIFENESMRLSSDNENFKFTPEKENEKAEQKKRKTTKLGAVGLSASLAVGAAARAILKRNVAIPQLGEIDISLMDPKKEKPIDI